MYSKNITGAALAPVSGSLNVYSGTVSPVRHTVKTISSTGRRYRKGFMVLYE